MVLTLTASYSGRLELDQLKVPSTPIWARRLDLRVHVAPRFNALSRRYGSSGSKVPWFS